MIVLVIPFCVAFCCELGVPAAEPLRSPPSNFAAAQGVAAEPGDRREERIERREDRQKDRDAKEPDGSTFWERSGNFFGKIGRTIFLPLELLDLGWRMTWILVAMIVVVGVSVIRQFFISNHAPPS